jgi:sodium-dependent dicarboxylate transporter 2/3/5
VSETRYATTPPPPDPPAGDPATGRDLRSLFTARRTPRILGAIAGIVVVVLLASTVSRPGAGLDGAAAAALVVFVLAVWFWIFTPVDDTYVALGAATALVVMGVIDTDELFQSLGDETVWLLLAAFVIASGVASSGLALRGAASVMVGARTPRQLFHLVTASLVVTTFAVPATSGRAALALPVFLALARVLADRGRIVVALSLLFPTVILLSAAASLLGAGAHLITSQIVETATGTGFDFVRWMLLGLPVALVSSHVACEIVLLLFTDRSERRRHLSIDLGDFEADAPTPVSGALTAVESRAALLLAAVIVLWCTEPLHGLHPAIVALLGALVATSPRYGSTSLGKALKAVPWTLILFLAATLTLGTALTSTGAAEWLAQGAFAPLGALGGAAGPVFVLAVIAVSLAAHLVIQSRSARSAALVPIVVALAPGVGVDPAAAAFASTAAAGFCHTLTSSAKPVAMFAAVDGVPGFQPSQLLRLSAVLGPVMLAIIAAFSWCVWPLLGLPLFLP